MKKPVFTGSAVAIVTPFGEDGKVNFDEFGRMLDYQIEKGTDAVVIVGTTGEASAMTIEEHEESIAFGCKHVNHRVPVIAGAGSNDTAVAVQLTRQAAACGADAVLSVTPYYNKTTQRGLIAHFNAIADCSDCPVILYSVPSRTGMGFTSDTYYELSKHPNINGVKEASGNFSLIAETIRKCGDNLNIWSGNDDQIVPLMAMGGKGVISVLANVAPYETHLMTQHCLNGNFEEAMKLQIGYLDLINDLFCEVNPIPVKKAMEMLGWNVGALRLPLVEMTAEHAATLQAELNKMGCKI